MRLTLKQIDHFLAVAEAGSFSRAAHRLRLAQPALSKSIKELEAEVGVRLFDRTTRRIELTDTGREFLASVAKIRRELDDAVRNVHDIAERRRGHIKVAAPPLLAAAVLPRAIADFRRRFPGITVEVIDVATDQIVESVRAGRADCALGTFRPMEDGVEGTTLVRDNLMLFCDRGTLRSKSSVTWAELSSYPLITLTRSSAIRLLVEVGFESAQVSVRPAYEVTHMTTALALVEAGLGVSILPSYARSIAGHYKVSVKALVNPSISRDISFVHRQGRSLSPAVSAFSAVIRQEVQRIASPMRRNASAS